MALHLLYVHHAEHGLRAVEAVTPTVPGLARRLVDGSDDVNGAVVLATCNRVEVYVDADADTETVRHAVQTAMVEGYPPDPAQAELLHDVELGEQANVDALQHLFTVGAGLDSMVVGDREISGQLRTALRSAQEAGTATGLLTETIEQALHTSREVSHLTQLATTGRSVVSVALDLLDRDWAQTDVLLVGTGAYAGAVVANLRSRGTRSISIYSSSGRAAAFVATHPGTQEASSDLVDEATGADVIITCRGVGNPVLRKPDLELIMAQRNGRPLPIVDLAVVHDVDPEAQQIPGLVLLDLDTVREHVPDASKREVSKAHDLVDKGLHDLLGRLKGREMDPAVVALRDTVSTMVEDEIARLPQDRPIEPDEVAHAMRRLAAKLVHVPSVNARRAAMAGRTDEYLTALSELWDLHPKPRTLLGTGSQTSADAETALEELTCPVTGLGIDDLKQSHSFEQPREEIA